MPKSGEYFDTTGNEWSFEHYPPVPEGGLTREQIRKRYSVRGDHDLNLRDLNCTKRLDNLIELYVEIYPRFEQHAKDEAWRRAWVEAFTLTPHYISSLDCLVLNDVMGVLIPENLSVNRDKYSAPYFCGQYSDHPVSEPVGNAVRKLVEMAIEYESESAAARLVSFGRAFSGPVSLNPDVMAYLAERYAWLDSQGQVVVTAEFMQSEFEHRGYSLTSERRAEVVAAARRGDAEAILSTTAPCKPYEAMKKSE
ncbi:MAG: hypothetical protein AB3N20_09560 [Rhizobiaceae bacterium]